MNKPNVTAWLATAKTAVSKHSPEILTGIGIAGMVTSTILAVRATPKALQKITDAEYDKGSPLTAGEKVKACWKCYIPATVTTITSAACLVGASSVNLKRNAALATAYKLSETALTEYKEKVVETIGEKKEQAIKDKIAKDKIEKNPTNPASIIVTGKGSTKFRDGAFGSTFISDIDTINRAVNELNRRMIGGEMYISLNEFYNEIGLSNVDMGDELGWNIDKGIIEVEFSPQLENNEPIIVMSYLVVPRHDYTNLH